MTGPEAETATETVTLIRSDRSEHDEL